MIFIPWITLILMAIIIPTCVLVLLFLSDCDDDGFYTIWGIGSIITFIAFFCFFYFIYKDTSLDEKLEFYKFGYISKISLDNMNNFGYSFLDSDIKKIQEKDCYLVYGITKKHYYVCFPVEEQRGHLLIGKNEVDIILQNYPQIQMKE